MSVNKIKLDIVTPERVTYSENVNMVIARAVDGDVGILPGHAPMIAALDTWPMRVLRDDGEIKIAISGGFLEARPKKVTILTNSAELPSEIDVKRAQAAKERAESRLKSKEGVDIERAEIALKKATTRLQAAGKT